MCLWYFLVILAYFTYLSEQQRQINAENISKMYKEIATDHTENKTLFYKLIDKQRQTWREILNVLIVNGEHL